MHINAVHTSRVSIDKHMSSSMDLALSHTVRNTVKPPKRGHFGTMAFVLSSEVVLFLEVAFFYFYGYYVFYLFCVSSCYRMHELLCKFFCDDLYKQVLQINKYIMYLCIIMSQGGYITSLRPSGLV